MSLFLKNLDFENSAEEFRPHETLSTLMKLLSPLSSLIWCHISIINIYKTLMKLIKTDLRAAPVSYLNRGSRVRFSLALLDHHSVEIDL
jgi:hypothetical protein